MIYRQLNYQLHLRPLLHYAMQSVAAALRAGVRLKGCSHLRKSFRKVTSALCLLSSKLGCTRL